MNNNPKWFVGLFETHNGKRIGIAEYYDQEEIDQINNEEILREKVLASGLTQDEADRQCGILAKEMGVEIFDNRYDSY